MIPAARKGLLSPTLSSKGGEGEDAGDLSCGRRGHARLLAGLAPSPPLEERVGERRPLVFSIVPNHESLSKRTALNLSSACREIGSASPVVAALTQPSSRNDWPQWNGIKSVPG